MYHPPTAGLWACCRKAWDALTPGDMRKIAPGLDLAKRLQQAILS